MKAMWKSLLAVLAVGLLMLVGLIFTATASAGTNAPAAQAPTPFPTPTPNANGEIIYTVQLDDTAWRIAALAGISLEELYALNGLQPTDFITPGMQLLLGTGGPPVSTTVPGLEGSPTPIPLTPTPISGTGDICGMLFTDVNGNARLDPGEPPLENGLINVSDSAGQQVGEATTDADPEGQCFAGLINGDYNVSAAVPDDYNPTTALNIPIRLEPGDIMFVEFGAQPSGALSGAVGGADGGRSTILGVAGGLLLLIAGFLAYQAARYNRRRSPMSLR